MRSRGAFDVAPTNTDEVLINKWRRFKTDHKFIHLLEDFQERTEKH